AANAADERGGEEQSDDQPRGIARRSDGGHQFDDIEDQSDYRRSPRASENEKADDPEDERVEDGPARENLGHRKQGEQGRESRQRSDEERNVGSPLDRLFCLDGGTQLRPVRLLEPSTHCSLLLG